ncbi:transcriptional regulator [Enterococcus silesiacus]|uniref:Transcriptional regulator n=1 Tax=Enterococcus silesiacus TaxID=332949 RepID=A0A0S3K846_9ENTE|nr:winged helix-turn-helix transcriptional regulator [Enterococcus silesiacus]ALS00477.1 transcriptional regulator [Enterococcus silesiacus]OJG91289.1 HTH-type transcriptional regulator [Enterococcus silesiacus]
MSKIPKEGFFLLQDVIKGKWKSSLLQHMNAGSKRPKDLLSLCHGISTKVLNEQLKQLKQDGLVERIVFPEEVPVKVEYSLTKYGKQFVPLLYQLCELGEAHAKRRDLPVKEIIYLEEDNQNL